MADHRRRHQITTRNSKNNILHGVRLLILISRDIAENPGPNKFPCGSCAKWSAMASFSLFWTGNNVFKVKHISEDNLGHNLHNILSLMLFG
jgi:hypothetical protein